MRKRQILFTTESTPPSERVWLELDRIVSVEVSSEEQGYPVESALLGDDGHSSRAANPGTQIVRLVFDSFAAEPLPFCSEEFVDLPN